MCSFEIMLEFFKVFKDMCEKEKQVFKRRRKVQEEEKEKEIIGTGKLTRS